LDVISISISFLFLVLGIMILAGILAGTVSYFLMENQRLPVGKAIFRYCLLGISAALTVPLFLKIISSDLLAQAQRSPANLLVFNGVCLIFAFVACRFKEIVFIKRTQDVEKDKKENTIVIPIKTEYGLDTARQEFKKDKTGKDPILSGELKILRSIVKRKHAHTSLVDLLKDPDLADEKINETLSSLMAKGFVEQRLSKENKLLLYLTPKGDSMLRHTFGQS
jgi:DNA-binding MarR family transcriptional regulator